MMTTKATTFKSNPHKDILIETVSKINSPGKGILAADESIPTIGKRFASIDVKNTFENRVAYRELLFTTPNIEEYISGVIMFEETLESASKENVKFIDFLKGKGIVPGVKVDKGTRQLPFSEEGNLYSVGFEDLDKRCKDFFDKGVRFVKWRSVLQINENGIDENAIRQVSREQALYAAVCQENGLVPIVEPEILSDGDHSREECMFYAEKVLSSVVKELNNYCVMLEGCLLKPTMVTSGVKNKSRESEDLESRIVSDSECTVISLRRSVPAAMGGIFFLSGGQSEEEAALHLNEINRCKKLLPWNVSFSYGRALQSSTLKAWCGKSENIEKAQEVFGDRMKSCSLAQKGELKVKWDNIKLGENLHVSKYTY